jgi:hypothetical protein
MLASFPSSARLAAGGNRNRTRWLQFDTMSERACENCARDDDDLVAVHRVYVVPESWDTPGSSQTVDEVELWCFSCRSQYPHEEAEPA